MIDAPHSQAGELAELLGTVGRRRRHCKYGKERRADRHPVHNNIVTDGPGNCGHKFVSDTPIYAPEQRTKVLTTFAAPEKRPTMRYRKGILNERVYSAANIYIFEQK